MTRKLFEDVAAGAENAARAPAPGVAAADAKKRAARRMIMRWLWAVAALVFVMILVGGMTRLTDSGLSITEWNLVFGTLPPLSDAHWASEFAKYQNTTEYRQINAGMTLEAFKGIYWWEWGHRLLGRFIGLVYLLPLLFFAATKRIPRGWGLRLVVIGLLIALQGAVGWWMVYSGLGATHRTDVAPYRLAAHLGMAFGLFALLINAALNMAQDESWLLQARRRRSRGLTKFSAVLLCVILFQVIAGALVAGLDAGKQYTDWPMMGAEWFPSEGAGLTPFWHNFFEDAALTQFNHRLIAYGLMILVLAYWLRAKRSGHAGARRRAGWLAMGVWGQAMLGVSTLMHGAPVGLSILHQGCAALLTALAVLNAHRAAYPEPEAIARG